eukprot:4383488-Pyramimonas_sp.AAC.1
MSNARKRRRRTSSARRQGGGRTTSSKSGGYDIHNGTVLHITPVRPYLEVGAPRITALVAMLCYAMLCC